MRSTLRSRLLTVSVPALVLLAFVAAVGGTAAQGPIDDFITACSDGSNNPYLVTTCFRLGFKGENASAIVAYRDTPDNSGHITLATPAQVGSVYGLSYNARTETLYAAAFHKRGVHFGPAGPGGIYALDVRSGAVSTFATVPNAGGDNHDAAGDYFPDTPARFAAGRTSLGDLDLKGDGSELAVMNLNDRKIYRFAVPGGASLGSFDHGAAGAAWAGDARPFGLKYRDGKLFHGVVRTAESSQDRGELSAHVYESAPDGSGMREVASTGLIYERGEYWSGEGNAVWNPWIDPPGVVFPGYGRYAMPMLADIEFTENLDQMILGFRDRFGDTTFYTQRPQVPPPGELFNNVPAGDILPAFPDGDRWRIQIDPEYYTGDFGSRPSGQHDETSFGGLAMIPNVSIVAMSANSPLRTNSAGGVWLNTSTGNDTAREEIYAFNDGDNLGKANGLGDVEALCDTMDQPTPTPPATDTSVPTDTPVPSNTPAPSSTPVRSSTPKPTSSATASVVPSATATLPPGVTPTATPLRSATPTAPATSPPKEHEQPPASATVTLPELPKTGGGGMARGGPEPSRARSAVLVVALVVIAVVAMAVARRVF